MHPHVIEHRQKVLRLTWFEVERGERLWVEEVEGGSDCEQHVVVVYLVQNDENQISYLETEEKRRKKKNPTVLNSSPNCQHKLTHYKRG